MLVRAAEIINLEILICSTIYGFIKNTFLNVSQHIQNRTLYE